MKKRIVALVMALAMLLMALPAMADAPVIEKIEYEGNGRVEVEFARDVKYKNSKVKVTDWNGKKMDVTVKERDEDSVTFRIDGVKAGKEYDFTISGVKVRGTSGYGKVKGSFTTPDAQLPAVEELEVKKNGRIEVEFAGKVQYRNLKVKVKDAAGKKYTVSVVKKDNDELDVKVTGLKSNTEYTLVINGVRTKGTDEYGKLKVSFTTPEGMKTPAAKKNVYIRSVDSDAGDDEMEVEFNTRVEYSNLKVTVTDASGRSLSVRVLERDDDSLDIRASGLTARKKYTVRVSGVRARGTTGSYGSVSKTFTARND